MFGLLSTGNTHLFEWRVESNIDFNDKNNGNYSFDYNLVSIDLINNRFVDIFDKYSNDVYIWVKQMIIKWFNCILTAINVKRLYMALNGIQFNQWINQWINWLNTEWHNVSQIDSTLESIEYHL